jgi:hypothetical protein
VFLVRNVAGGATVYAVRRLIERNGLCVTILPALPGSAGIAHDRKEPCSAVAAIVTVEKSKGAQAGFLDHILGVRVVVC